MALGPDGVPRGAPTGVRIDDVGRNLQVLVDPSGARALVLFGEDVGVRALPLRCAG